MGSEYVILVMRLKWLHIKSSFFRLLPVKSAWRRNFESTYRLLALKLKSRIQERIVRSVFGQYAYGVVFKSYNGLLMSNFSDIEISSQLGFAGAYDRHKIDFLKSIAADCRSVYIVGAHIGTLLVPMSLAGKEIVAFEANPITFQYLRNNVALNHLTHVRMYNYALYDRDARLPFYQSKANTGGSKIKPVHDHFIYNYDEPELIEVVGRPLDDVVTSEGIDLPDLIIMDIEGAEFHALGGAYKCLSTARYLYIEFVPHHLKNVAHVSIDAFIAIIMKHFTAMCIVDEAVRHHKKTYRGDEIVQRLTQLYQVEVAVDLLFNK